MKRYILILGIVILVIITYFTAFFIKKNRSFDENSRLKQENQDLIAQIQRLQVAGGELQNKNNNFISAKVFSTYPFNIKNKITIDAGEKQGVKKNMVVVLGENILVGQILEVFENYSVVQTIFDPNWQLPARIGQEEINGLFQGGGEPKVTLIEKNKPFQVNDAVYSASQEFPYGLKIGEVVEIKESSAGVFKEAILKMLFNVNELREVNIIK